MIFFFKHTWSCSLVNMIYLTYFCGVNGTGSANCVYCGLRWQIVKKLDHCILLPFLFFFSLIFFHFWTCLAFIFCLSHFLAPLSQPSANLPPLSCFPVLQMTIQATAVTSSWHHPISRLWLCHVSVHMLWQKQYNQIGKQGDQVPPEAFRESQGMRGKSWVFLTEEDPAVLGGVRSSCQLKYLKEIFSVFKVLFIPPSIPLALQLNCSLSTLSTVTHTVFFAFLSLGLLSKAGVVVETS